MRLRVTAISERSRARASRARHRALEPPSRWSISTPSGPTPPTWNGAPRPSRSGSPASRCAAARCRSGCSRAPAFRGRSPSPCPRRCGWPSTASRTSSSPTQPPIAGAAALARLTAERPETRITIMVDCSSSSTCSTPPLPCPGVAHHPSASPPPQADRAAVPSAWSSTPALAARRAGAYRRQALPVHTPAQAAALAREIVAREGVELVGLMAYEAQIAGLGDAPAGRDRRCSCGLARSAPAGASRASSPARRAAAVAAVRAVAQLEFVNGGGTGSLEGTARESAVTELAAGSGLYGPTLFDAYRAFTPRPAALFALPVVRRPSPGVVTALGGGYLASGPAERAPAPTPSARRPAPRSPGGRGRGPDAAAGCGRRRAAVGDRVWFRHAKAGELCERFERLYLIEGDRIVEEVPTYRGEGQCFLVSLTGPAAVSAERSLRRGRELRRAQRPPRPPRGPPADRGSARRRAPARSRPPTA